MTHLAAIVTNLEKQVAEQKLDYTQKAHDFEDKGRDLENTLREQIAGANRNAKGLAVELAARVDIFEISCWSYIRPSPEKHRR